MVQKSILLCCTQNNICEADQELGVLRNRLFLRARGGGVGGGG